MHIVLGATGHVGSAVAHTLLDRGEPVTVVTRHAPRAEPFARRGAAVAVTDVHEVDELRAILRRGRRAFLLMPPADPRGDSVAEERRAVAAIARAVDGAGLEKVVVQSTYGARPGEGMGDLGVLWEFEQAIERLGVPASMLRGAYFMSNWDSALGTARADGVVHTFFPPDFALPMVAPGDLGRAAARLLTDEAEHTGVHHVEGPRTYSTDDVARALAAALGREVAALEIPRAEWANTFQALGFSDVAAGSYTRMIEATLEETERPGAPERGMTTLDEYIASRVNGS